MHHTHFHGHTIAIGSRADYLDELQRILAGKTAIQVITLNPEYVFLAARNAKLTALTQPPAVVIPDGIGLVWALRSRKLRVERYPGADSLLDICTAAQATGHAVAVLASATGLSTPNEIQTALKQRFSNLQVRVVVEGQLESLSQLQQWAPQVLFVTFGQPRQDLWISEHLQDIPSLRLAMGVGGAVDFLTGKRKRAPRLMQRLGVEWLWRLLTQPQRLPRMLRATFGFWYTLLTTP